MKKDKIIEAILMHKEGKNDSEKIAKDFKIWPNNATLGVIFDEIDILRKIHQSTNCNECGIIIKKNLYCKQHEKTRRLRFDDEGERID